jgi:hypothetical protein
LKELKNNKVVSLIDFAGYDKYLKTTVSGINEKCMICVSRHSNVR